MPDFSQLGTSFLPGSDPQQLKRRQSEGEALRVLAMTLPQMLGPGTVAPDILLNSQGSAGGPQGAPRQASPLANTIAESIINQVLGNGTSSNGDPLAGYRAQIAPQPTTASPTIGPGAPLSSAGSLTDVVRQEASNPTGQLAPAALTPAPNIAGAAPPLSSSGGAPTPSLGPPRVIPADTPTTGVPGEQLGASTDPSAGGPPVDLGSVLDFLRNRLGRPSGWQDQPTSTGY